MKSIIKLAVGAAIAGAVVSMLMKQQRSRRGMSDSSQDSRQGMSGSEGPEQSTGEGQIGSQPGGGFTLGELAADTNTVNSGNAAQDQRERQPQDWRGAQNVQDS